MNVREVLDLLQNLTKTKISQTELGNVLGKTRSDISLKAKRGTEIKLNDIRKIEEYYNVDLINAYAEQSKDIAQISIAQADLEFAKNRIVDYYPDVFGSCGTGVFVPSEEKEPMSVPKECFSSFSPYKIYSVINAIGNSMQPYIYEKDKLIVEHWDGEQIRDNKVYIFAFGNEIFVKRLVKNINQLVIISDNKDYDTIKLLGNDLEKIHIIGQVVGIMRDSR